MFPDNDDPPEKVYVALTVLEQIQKLRDEHVYLSEQFMLLKARSDNAALLLDVMIHSMKQANKQE